MIALYDRKHDRIGSDGVWLGTEPYHRDEVVEDRGGALFLDAEEKPETSFTITISFAIPNEAVSDSAFRLWIAGVYACAVIGAFTTAPNGNNDSEHKNYGGRV